MTNMRPLSLEEKRESKKVENQPDRTCISKIPDDAIRNFAPSGNPVRQYNYYNSENHLQMIVCRYEEGSKRFLPFTYWIDNSTGIASWQAKALDSLCPLYNLKDILKYTDRKVVICEGEKAAEAATKLLPDYAVVTSAFGANSAAKTDFSPLSNKHIIIWIDNDKAGISYAQSIKQLLGKVGIKSLKITSLDDSKKAGWDADDALKESWDNDKAKNFVEEAPLIKLEPILPEYFTMNSKGVFYQKDNEDEQSPICQKIEIIAQTADRLGESHGIILSWEDTRTKQRHKETFLSKNICSDISEVISRLVDKGFKISPARRNKERFAEFLAGVISPYFKTNVSCTGWNDDFYVLPDQIFPITEEVILLADSSHYTAYNSAGSLEEWQENIGKYAANNSLLTFAISLAFASAIMKLVDEHDSGGFHIIGSSSIGKSTVLAVAASVWGNSKFVKQWRTTGNALEAIAETHKDSLLILDELGQVDGKMVGDAIYMLANNQGKARMHKNAELKKTYRWILLFLSSGEITLEEKMAESGKQFKAGMDVRFINLEAKMSEDFGVFENIHNINSPAEFSRHLKDSCNKYYGTAIRSFLSGATKDIQFHSEYLKSQIKHFLKEYCSSGFLGEISRVQQRFALVAAAGELAIKLGILPLNNGDSHYAAHILFNNWFAQRDGEEKLEERKTINQVREYLIRYGDSRFSKLNADKENIKHERIGWKEETSDNILYFIPPQTYKSDICAGISHKIVTAVLQKHKCLLIDSAGKAMIQKRIPEMNKNMRVYCINGNIFE